jgi:hypothetical protein
MLLALKFEFLLKILQMGDAIMQIFHWAVIIIATFSTPLHYKRHRVIRKLGNRQSPNREQIK